MAYNSNCTQFGYILSEWHGRSLRGVQAEHQGSLAAVESVAMAAVQRRPRRRLVAVAVCVRAGRGIVDPVQDDEGHAAAHDQDTTEQKGGSLGGGGI